MPKKFTPFEAEDERLKQPGTEPIKPLAASLTYEEYKRQNDLKVLEEISKQTSGRSDSTATSISMDNLLSVVEDRDAQFFAKMDDLLRQFVEAMKEIRCAYNNHLKH